MENRIFVLAMPNRLFLFISIFVLSLNTVEGQNVASEQYRVLAWKTALSDTQQICGGTGLSFYRFESGVLPAVSESFYTEGKSTLAFFDLQYEALQSPPAFTQVRPGQLAGEVPAVVYHGLEGSQGFTGYYLCPFKEDAGVFYRLKSYRFKVQDGSSFSKETATASNSKRAASQSVLSSGNWFRFSVQKDGLYKIDAAMLRAAGLDLSTLDPRKLKLYGHQGGMLPEKISEFRHDDLPENAIMVTGESDGRFDNGDYILFYAQSPHKWKYSPAENRYKHETNIYSDKTWFFLTADGDNGKRMSLLGDGNALTADASFNWFNYHEYHEDEKENICREGRIFLGEKFDQNLSYSFNHNIPGLASQLPLQVWYSAGAVATVNSNLTLKINGLNADQMVFPSLFSEEECFTGGLRSASVPATQNIQIAFTYNKPQPSARAWLDYYELHLARNLSYAESFMPFRNIQSAQALTAEYRLSGLPGSALVLDVSDPLQPAVQAMFSDNGESVFRSAANGVIREYVLSDGNFLQPVYEGKLANQNLHGAPNAQFIIISHPDFMEASERLAQFHRQRDGLEVLVLTPQQIYNEFSSGSQDISAIRDFFRFMYYRNTNPVNQLRYAMLMGDASYDYKDRIAGNTNFVPVFEADPKLGIPYTFDYYCSDDFYGFLDSLDGAWKFEQKLEISVSRVPVMTAEEAEQFVDKVIRYKDPASLGEWRNAVTLCADDADAAWEKDFVSDFENMAASIDTLYKNVNVRKVYLDAFKQQNLGGSQRYPEAQEAIRQEFDKGTLIFNYVGHGGEEYLASEKVIDIPMITAMKNGNNLPAFFTATCEFSRYDDVQRKSAGEYLFTQPEGGAIAMFTTTRLVYAGANAELTEFFWNYCAYTKIGGKWPTLGEVYKKLKNRNWQNNNDRKFTLFADPALSLNYPEHIILIDSINGSAPGNDTLKALSKVIFTGHIEDVFGQKQTGFNGTIYPTVYDKKTVFRTLSNDLSNQTMPFSLYSNILYKGQNSVENGDYSFSFVVPKDINYNYGYGKISLYADNGSTDAAGHQLNLVVGGTSSIAPQDNKGPVISLYIDDFSFVSGGLSDNTPLLLARVSDENGINTTGTGIGRDIVAIIDKGTPHEKRFVLNSYYTARLNSYTGGDIRYQLEGISDGLHTYTLKVWDVYNNSSEATIEFRVVNGNEFTIQNVMNYPNPFRSNTTFHFEHNRAGENLQLTLSIMNLSGQIVKTIEAYVPAAESHVGVLQWEGRDVADDKSASGIYMYRLTVLTDDGQRAEKVEKLLILN